MIKCLFTILIALISYFSFGQDLYDISSITEIKLTFNDPNWDATMDTYYANDLDELLYGTCEINGLLYDSVGVAFKGNSTYNENNAKNPLKIKLAAVYEQNHQGYQTLKLANGDKDPSFIREVLGYEIGRKYMDMPLSNYAKVYINGNLYGLFSNSESINGDFIEKRFYSDRDNTRIKCNPSQGGPGNNGPSLEYLGTDTTLYYNSYELKSDYGWTDLMNFTNNLANNMSDVELFLDVDKALWMLAYNNVIISLDSYTGPIRQNYYMIMDDNGRMMPVIWDLNGCFGAFTMLNGGPGSPPAALVDLAEMDPYIRENDPIWALIYQLFSVERYRKQYMAHCRTIFEQNFVNNWYYTRGQELQDIIDAEVQADPNGFYPYSAFVNNLDNQIGTGMGGKFGVAEVAEARKTFLSSHSDYALIQPTISNVSSSVASPVANSTITITATISNASYAYLGYRYYKANRFEKVQMFDDGAHNDGASGDGVFGIDINLGASDMQYYVYAENADAAKFSPVRAEHEFYELTLSSTVVINEIMPSNNVTLADQDGEFDDWIELYNNTNSDIDLSGYFLTDDELIVNKWIFPLGAVIPANDYLIVWCDNDILQNGLHTAFKLSSSGETLLLSDASENPINMVTYPQIADNMTYGRYVNGTGGFIPMMPTPESENTFTAVAIDEKNIKNTDCILYPNPAQSTVNIQFNSDQNQLVNVYNINGQLAFSNLLKPVDEIDLTNFNKGIYIVHIPDLGLIKKLMVR